MNNKTADVINADEAYSKATLMERLCISQKFWDKMLDERLPFTSVGHTRWVTGRDLLRYFDKCSQTKEPQAH